MKSLFQIRRDIVEVGRRAYRKGYIAAYEGNISERLDERRFVITPAGVPKGFMTPEELLTVDYEGGAVSAGLKPSSEIRMHCEIYKNRPDIRAIVHLHPPYATAFAAAGVPLDQNILPETVLHLGTIPLIPYGTPGTEELSHQLAPFIGKHDAFLLANHGSLALGADVMTAYFRTEILEHAAHIIFIARQIGSPNVLNEEQVDKLVNLRQQSIKPRK